MEKRKSKGVAHHRAIGLRFRLTRLTLGIGEAQAARACCISLRGIGSGRRTPNSRKRIWMALIRGEVRREPQLALPR